MTQPQTSLTQAVTAQCNLCIVNEDKIKLHGKATGNFEFLIVSKNVKYIYCTMSLVLKSYF